MRSLFCWMMGMAYFWTGVGQLYLARWMLLFSRGEKPASVSDLDVLILGKVDAGGHAVLPEIIQGLILPDVVGSHRRSSRGTVVIKTVHLCWS